MNRPYEYGSGNKGIPKGEAENFSFLRTFWSAPPVAVWGSGTTRQVPGLFAYFLAREKV